jgi:iron(III) transport system ATP-binding protein
MGETLALVGESGSGKTTLLRLAAGLEAPDDGEIRIAGETVAGDRVWIPPERRKIAMVFQDGALFPHLTVEDNIGYGIRGKTRDQRRSIVQFMLAMVGLNGFQTRYPHELSGGERQRLALARALAPQPAVVLLDEPFSSLDPSLRRSLRDEVRRILEKLKATSIIVTHDTDDALIVGDRIAVFRQGRIEQLGTKSDVYHHPRNGYCARLFGPANFVPCLGGNGERWVRPEDMNLLDTQEPGSVPVQIDRIRDAGRHLEALARPLPWSVDRVGEWVLELPPGHHARAKDRKWVSIRSAP